jgi:hypothetical protein
MPGIGDKVGGLQGDFIRMARDGCQRPHGFGKPRFRKITTLGKLQGALHTA